MRTLIEQAEYVRAARKMYLGERNSSVGHDQVVIDAYLKNYNKHLDAFAEMLVDVDIVGKLRRSVRHDTLEEVRVALNELYAQRSRPDNAFCVALVGEGEEDGIDMARGVVEKLQEADATVIDITLRQHVWSVCAIDLTHATSRSPTAALDAFLEHELELDRTPKSKWPATVVLAGTTGEGKALVTEIVDVPAYIAEHHPSWPTNPR